MDATLNRRKEWRMDHHHLLIFQCHLLVIRTGQELKDDQKISLPFLDHEKSSAQLPSGADQYHFPGMREIVSYQFLLKNKKWKRILRD